MALNDNDLLLINDSQDGNEAKRITLATLKTNTIGEAGNNLQQVTENGNSTTLGANFGGGVTSNGDDAGDTCFSAQLNNVENIQLRADGFASLQSGASQFFSGGDVSFASGNITLDTTGTGVFANGVRCSTFRSQRADNTLTALLGAFATTDGNSVEKCIIRGDGVYIGEGITNVDSASPDNAKITLNANGEINTVALTRGALSGAAVNIYSGLGTTSNDFSGGAVECNTYSTIADENLGNVPGSFKVRLNGTTTFQVTPYGTLGIGATLNGAAIMLRPNGDAAFTGDLTAGTVNGASILIDNGDGTTLDVKDRLSNLLSRLSAVENADISDDAEHSALLTLVANLATRVTTLEQQLAGGN